MTDYNPLLNNLIRVSQQDPIGPLFSPLEDILGQMAKDIVILQQQLGASSPTTASRTMADPSGVPAGLTPAQTPASSLQHGEMVLDLGHVAHCSACQDLLGLWLESCRTLARDADGTTWTSQRPASWSSAAGTGPAQSPSSESTEAAK